MTRPYPPAIVGHRTQRAEVYHICRLYGVRFGGKISFCATYQEGISFLICVEGLRISRISLVLYVIISPRWAK
jgi:hypothetical protein